MKSAQSVSQSVSQSFFASGDPVSASYQATLEDLAAKRRGLADVITALAKVAGVDPAPYLDPLVAVSDADVDAVVAGLREASKPKEPAPPRPQQPAPLKTAAAGQHKGTMKRDYPTVIIAALKQADEPMAPRELCAALGVPWETLKHHINVLISNGRLKATGVTRSRRISLA